ncbi:MAG TPA: trehalase family glycosidase, partial [bacterium]|nr:trehalase family glycosidase [bacterium]
MLPNWITLEKKTGNEAKYFRKAVSLSQVPEKAEVLFTSSGPCAFFLNGEFIEASTGRYLYRINRHDLTGRLKAGPNVLCLRVLSCYFQDQGKEEFKNRRHWISWVALMLRIFQGKDWKCWVTDATWKARGEEERGWLEADFDDHHWVFAREIKRVTPREYQRFWAPSALWKNKASVEKDVGVAVAVVGQAYREQLELSWPGEVLPEATIKVNHSEVLKRDTGLPDYIWGVRIKAGSEDVHRFPFPERGIALGGEKREVLLDFGRLVVGYLRIEFDRRVTGKIRCEFDYSETLTDFYPRAVCGRQIIEKLAVEEDLENQECWVNYRRRAFRYLKLSLLSEKTAVLRKVKVRESRYPVINRGWFRCSDQLLNQIWQVSRYTLLVNMHQEYESCPRNEMLFFPGDGRVDGLIDYYCFGEGSLMKASLSLTEPADAVAFVPDIHQEKDLWDYPAWRVLCLSDYYRFHKDRAFVKDCWPWVVRTLDWYCEKLDPEGLIYQRPFQVGHQINEWTCARHRLGYKVSLNSLFFWALSEMAELAGLVGDSAHFQTWSGLAERVKKAINNRLWDKQTGVYRDSLYDYIPQDGNILAIMAGLTGQSQRASILKLLKERHWSAYGSALLDLPMPRDGNLAGNAVISPLMCAYEAAVRLESHRPDDGLELIRRCWGTMLRKGARTFWEFTWNDADSRWPIAAHAWSAGPAWVLPEYLSGVKPGKPGWQEIVFSPSLTSLNWTETVVPVGEGLMAVRLERNSSREFFCTFFFPENVGALRLIVPAGWQARITGGDTSHIHFRPGHLLFTNSGSYNLIFSL